MRLYIITPIYSNTTSKSGTTPVVHYFAKEWAKLGVDVHVYHIRARFPRAFYVFARIFQHKLNSLFGSLVPIEYPTNSDYEVDGVKVHRFTVRKFLPHSRYSRKKIKCIVDIMESGFSQFGRPDVLIGHWHNPSIDVITEFKRRSEIKACLVLHENSFKLEDYYGAGIVETLKRIDVIGFRNRIAEKNYIAKYGFPKSSFIAYSGVSPSFLVAGSHHQPIFEDGIDRFVYVGSLIARKNPSTIVRALDNVYTTKPYTITFIGDGDERHRILTDTKGQHKNTIVFTGRLDRDEIINYLKQAQVFVMVSKDEVFGLVYLEAMALGLIPIGSREEGVDGIIIDGYNGFLCKAGDENELASIIGRINRMTIEELLQVSQNAKLTAQSYSDSNVAKHYLQSIS